MNQPVSHAAARRQCGTRFREGNDHVGKSRVGKARVIAIPLMLAVMLAPAAHGAEPRSLDLNGSHWVWSSQQAPETSVDSCFLRKTFVLGEKPRSATIALTADNGFDLYVNGHYVAGEGGLGAEIWQTVERFRIEPFLVSGANVIAVQADNLGGPGGMVAVVEIELAAGPPQIFRTDSSWRVALLPRQGWTEADHNDSLWAPAAVLGELGMAPWGRLTIPDDLSTLKPRSRRQGRFSDAADSFAWPEGVVFVAGHAPLNSTPGAPQAKWPILGSRAFFEHDTPTPPALGRRLYALTPARPDGVPRLLVDAGRGVLGSPACSYDGQEIVFAMAEEGGKFFKIYRVGADGSGLAPLTSGPWHDYDPAFLPDGRIVFASTRIGSRDEYHANVARSLFTLSADRHTIRPLTHHIVGDSEPTVMADGRIAFVRSDNFLERAKVETHIHAVRADGTAGEVLLGPNRGAIGFDRSINAEDEGLWLRNLGFGSPAPLPDGRVASLSHRGLVVTPAAIGRLTKPESGDPTEPPTIETAAAISHPATDPMELPTDIELFDISPLPDGRLLCSTILFGALGVLDPDTGAIVLLHQIDGEPLHSVRYLGPQSKPPTIGDQTRTAEPGPNATGWLLCQNIFASKQEAGDWQRVKAVRIFTGRPFTTRAARHPYGHIGTEGIELGTVPLAPDGSFHVRVPADRALAIQAVDAEGRAVVSELSWIYVRPGERRSCVGCHSPRQSAPVSSVPLAAQWPAIDLTGEAAPHRFRANNAANGGVLNLQFDRFREAASIDLYRQDALAIGADPAQLPPGRAAEEQKLIRLLASGTVGQRLSAARRLGLFRDRAAAPALVGALTDDEPQVRLAAVISLAASGDRASVAPLLERLTDDDPAVAQAAAHAIEHLTGHHEPYRSYGNADDRRSEQEDWRNWLAGHPWDQVEQELVDRLTSNEEWVSQLAIEALSHVGGDVARRALRGYLESERATSLRARMATMRALGHLRDAQAVPLLTTILRENIKETPFAPPKNHEFGWTQEPIQLAAVAAEALGWIATPEAEESLITAFHGLAPFWYYTFRNGDHEWLKGCHSSLPHYRIIESLDAAGTRVDRTVVAGLLRSVPMDPDRGLLHENDSYEALTARIVHRSGLGGEVVDACLAILEGENSGSADFVQAVSASPPAVSVGELSPPARAAHLLSVVSLRPEDAPRALAAFERYRAAEPSAQRSWVCFFLARTLGKLGDSESVPVLIAALSQDPTEASFGIPDAPNVFLHEAMTPLYRASAAYALGRIGASESEQVLLDAVSNFDNAMDVREAAAHALGSVARRERLPELQELADRYPEVATQRALWASCAALRDRSR